MDQNYVTLATALVCLGASSGIELTAQRRGLPIGGAAGAVASIAGLADIILVIVAFVTLPIGSAVTAVVIGIVGTIILAKVLPDTIAWVVITAVVGSVAAVAFLGG